MVTADPAGISEINPPSAVLLLGSGFSLEGRNIYDKAPPNGSDLRKYFIEQLGLPNNTTYDLQVLAEEFAAEDKEVLYTTLYNLFTISEIGPNQSSILSENWLRIYTTNYDNTVETYRRHAIAFSASDPIPNRLEPNSIIHLHGSVALLNEDNALEQLVLGETSYIKQYVTKSPWWTQFQTDLKFASHFFIIGYSMSDYHISALLLEDPTLAERTFFIQRPERDPIFQRRTAAYGRTLFIGMDGFVGLLKALPRPKPLTDLKNFKCLRFLNPHRDRKAVRQPTAIEVQNLLIYGTFNYSRCADMHQRDYVIRRKEQVERSVDFIENGHYKSVIIDSRLGNGKTIFLYLVFFELAARGYTCLMFKEAGHTLDKELKALENFDKLVVMFDEYANCQDAIQLIARTLPKAKFIVEIRTSIFEVRFHEVSRAVPAPYERLSLNYLSAEDVLEFNHLCRKAGIPTTKSSQGRELREFILELLDSEHFKRKLIEEIGPIFEHSARRKVLLLTMLLGKFHLSADAGFIRAVTGVDPYHEFRSDKAISDELFETSLDEFRIRSAIFSEFAVRHLLHNVDEISTCIIDASLAAAERKRIRVYRVLMGNLLRYDNLEEVFRAEVNKNELIIRLYERLRHDERIYAEPLFWLQYAIAAAVDNNLVNAENFIATAYDRAAVLPNFRTYQIDTYAFNIVLRIETNAPSGTPVKRIKEILKKLELFDSMLNEESQRDFAIEVLEQMNQFLQKRRNDLSEGEKVGLVFWLNKIINSLTRLPSEYQVRVGSNAVKTRLEIAKQLLL